MKSLVIAAVSIVMLAGCGGDDTSSSGDDTSGDLPSTESGSQGPSGGSGTAEVTIGGETYEFTQSDSCDISGNGVLVGFSDAENVLSLTATGDVVLVRLSIDGTQWVDTGSPDAPTVSGSSAKWSGELSEFDGGNSKESASITIDC